MKNSSGNPDVTYEIVVSYEHMINKVYLYLSLNEVKRTFMFIILAMYSLNNANVR